MLLTLLLFMVITDYYITMRMRRRRQRRHHRRSATAHSSSALPSPSRQAQNLCFARRRDVHCRKMQVFGPETRTQSLETDGLRNYRIKKTSKPQTHKLASTQNIKL